MPSPSPTRSAFLVFLLAGAALSSGADDRDQLKVGRQADGRIIVPTNQVLAPAGKQVEFPGRPVDLALAEEGKTLVVKNQRGLLFLDVAAAKVKQTLAAPTGFSAVGLLVQGEFVYVSDADNSIRIARRQKDGLYKWQPAIALDKPKVGGVVYPTGLCLQSASLWAASSRGNSVQWIDLAGHKVAQVVPVGAAPYMICCPSPNRCYVSNWGGDLPGKDAPQAASSGTAVRVDARTGVSNHGTVSVLERASGQWRPRKTIAVGLHPSGMIASKDGRFLYVANANSDTVSVIDAKAETVVETIACRPEARLPFGSGSNAPGAQSRRRRPLRRQRHEQLHRGRPARQERLLRGRRPAGAAARRPDSSPPAGIQGPCKSLPTARNCSSPTSRASGP